MLLQPQSQMQQRCDTQQQQGPQQQQQCDWSVEARHKFAEVLYHTILQQIGTHAASSDAVSSCRYAPQALALMVSISPCFFKVIVHLACHRGYCWVCTTVTGTSNTMDIPQVRKLLCIAKQYFRALSDYVTVLHVSQQSAGWSGTQLEQQLSYLLHIFNLYTTGSHAVSSSSRSSSSHAAQIQQLLSCPEASLVAGLLLEGRDEAALPPDVSGQGYMERDVQVSVK